MKDFLSVEIVKQAASQSVELFKGNYKTSIKTNQENQTPIIAFKHKHIERAVDLVHFGADGKWMDKVQQINFYDYIYLLLSYTYMLHIKL